MSKKKQQDSMAMINDEGALTDPAVALITKAQESQAKLQKAVQTTKTRRELPHESCPRGNQNIRVHTPIPKAFNPKPLNLQPYTCFQTCFLSSPTNMQEGMHLLKSPKLSDKQTIVDIKGAVV